MNDTKINERQEEILKYLATTETKSRSDIREALFSESDISRITLIRDLNELIELDFIYSKGSGRSVVYGITDKYSLLYPIDMDKYYSVDPDDRVLKFNTFNFEIFDILNNILDESNKNIFNSGKDKLTQSFARLDETIIKKELERFTIELSWKSSQIEGNTYTLLETEELIKNNKEAKGRNKDEAIMILNHKNAFDNILAHRNDYKEVSMQDLRTLHSVLIKDLDINAGIRKYKVGITGTKYIPLDNKHQIQEVLGKLFLLLSNIDCIPEASLVLLAMLSYIQPFADGNKRTARMISNALLFVNGYYPLSYRSVDEVEFKKAMLLFYEQNNIYHLKRLFIEQQRFAIDNYFMS